MAIGEEAVKLHAKGFNCAQSVLCANCSHTGLDSETAAAVTVGLGGGLRCGEVCGAFSGAVLVLGASRGYIAPDDTKEKTAVANRTKALMGEFREKFGALRCKDLKKAKISCDELIKFAAELADEKCK